MVINHLIQSTVFALAAGVLTLFLRNSHARTRYWIWLTASLKFLIPFSIFVDLGHRLTWSTAPAITQRQLAVVIDTISQPFIVSPQPAVFTPTATLPILPIIWIAVTAAILIVWFIRWRRVAALLRTSSRRIEPGVFGIFRPVLYLPPNIADHLDEAQLNAIVAHELCHIRRRDNLTAALHMLVEAVFWFHPLVWWIGTRLVEERERACDEEVVRNGSDPEVYAESILKVCKLYLESPLACISGVSGSDLKKRIEAIMINRVLRNLNPAKKIALTLAALTALALPVLAGIVHAQSNTPKFDVASIRNCGDIAKSGTTLLSTESFDACDTLEYFIRSAWVWYADGHFHGRTPGPPIEGGPEWLHSDRYRINAKATGTPGRDMISGPILQSLLEDRFALKLHRETREVPVYKLTIAKSGSKLQPFKEGSCVRFPPLQPGDTPPALKPGQLPCMNVVGLRNGPNMGLKAEDDDMPQFTQLLSLALGRPVIDKTGLTGTFNVHLEFVADESTPNFPPAPPSTDPAGPSIFTAIQQELGLKLEPTKGPVDVLVIDHVERPSEN